MNDEYANAFQLETSELLVNTWLRKYEREHFPDVRPPVLRVDVRSVDKGPACYLIHENVILIHPAVAPFLKVCRVLILHELIHRNLFKQFGDPDEWVSEIFQQQRERLWDENAYQGLL
jgi:hypothetical protein